MITLAQVKAHLFQIRTECDRGDDRKLAAKYRDIAWNKMIEEKYKGPDNKLLATIRDYCIDYLGAWVKYESHIPSDYNMD